MNFNRGVEDQALLHKKVQRDDLEIHFKIISSCFFSNGEHTGRGE